MTKEQHALTQIKAIFDAMMSGKITIDFNQDCFDSTNHIYGVKSILGLISNITHEGLGLDIPDLSQIWEESE